MESVITFANDGGLVLGICNGFQVLCEAHLLPGALLPNANLRFTSRQVQLDVVESDTAFTCACGGDRDLRAEGHLSVSRDSIVEARSTLSIPAKHSWGRYYADEPTLASMQEHGQVVLRYASGENFNGSLDDIAGVLNEQGNVFGLMPHPEHAVDELTGSSDGLCIFASMRMAVEGTHSGSGARV
jgi:phosphoribosylformylglycinamidine synthase